MNDLGQNPTYKSRIKRQNISHTRLLQKDGPGSGLSAVLGISAFDDDSVLLVGVTEGIWGNDSLGGRDFAVTKLNGSGVMEWSWQVINGTF